MAPADSIAGQYTIPVAIKEKLNDETGEVETEVGGIKARSGFARAKTGAKAEKLAEDVQANLTTDPGVYSAMQNIEGKEFSPPDVFDALGNRLTWDMLTDKGSKTQFACAAVVEVQILGGKQDRAEEHDEHHLSQFPDQGECCAPPRCEAALTLCHRCRRSESSGCGRRATRRQRWTRTTRA